MLYKNWLFVGKELKRKLHKVVYNNMKITSANI